MARKIVDIGVEGNDGTGDSIREAFRKSNDNFRELYAVFGQEGTLAFTDLGDTPASYAGQANKLTVVNTTGTALEFKELVGASGLEISYPTSGVYAGKIVLENKSIALINDTSPKLGGSLDARGNSIGNIVDPVEQRVNGLTGIVAITTTTVAGIATDTYYITDVKNAFGNIPTGVVAGMSLQRTSGQGAIGVAPKISTWDPNTGIIVFTVTSGPVTVGAIIFNALGIDPVANFNSLHGYAGARYVTADKFAVSRGYADRNYVNTNGDTMSGPLVVPAGATGAQVPRSNEVLLKTGGNLTGNLFLNDHPGELAGQGTPNGDDDLQAATKYYVDNTAYSSKVNLYVSTDGDNGQIGTPPGKEGRAWSYAYRTLSAACLRAEQLINDSPWEAGPYRQLIAYGSGAKFSEVTRVQVGQGINQTTRIRFTNDAGKAVDQGIPENRDIVPGKIVIGRKSGARGFIVRYRTDAVEDYVDLRDISGTFVAGENLEFDNPVKSLQISIFIESGTYVEDFPIKIPPNCAILGDEFRRTVIRPLDRVSQSPWAATWFYRDTTFDGLTTAQTNWGYHYLTDATNKASLPKNNRDMDVFLCNDATIIRQISCQGQGGFMMVLDPSGQILTKSPYCQQSGSFAGSINKQAFRGGQYVDGMAGSMPVNIATTNFGNTGLANGSNLISEVTITDAFKLPQTPTSFFVKGDRFKVDTFTDNGLGYRGAKELLTLNKDFIVAETIAYVNSVVTKPFDYDQADYANKLQAVLDAVAWDLVFDSNVQSILVGQSYYTMRGDIPVAILPTNKKAAFIDAIGYAKSLILFELVSNPSDSAIVAGKFDLIADIITDYGNVPDFDTPAPPAPIAPYSNASTVNSLNLLTRNREFVVAEYISYITQNFSDILYSVNAFTRDIERIYNAAIYDAIYGGNSLSTLVAKEFFDANGLLTVSGESTLVLSGLEHVKNLVRDIVLNVDIDYTWQGAVAQARVTNTNLIGSATVSALMTAYFAEVIDIITNGVNAAPAIMYPVIDNSTKTEINPARLDAKDTINNNTAKTKTATIEYIDKKYLYDQFRASIDIKNIVDAVGHDLVYTGNLKAVEHGLSYFVGEALFVSESERPRTTAIINYVERLALLIVDNDSVPTTALTIDAPVRRQSNILQTFNLGFDSGGSKTRLSELITIIRTMVADTKPVGYVDAKDLLTANVDYIKAEVTNYLDYKYSVSITATDAVTDSLTTTSTANLRVGMPIEFIGPNPFAENIIGTPVKTGTAPGPYSIVFTFARQDILPDPTIEYEILNNTNAEYNRSAFATASSYTSLTLTFTGDNPGDWGTLTTSRIRVFGGLIGGLTKETKYYIISKDANNTQFIVSSTAGGTAFPLTTATGAMKCTLSYNRETCARDVGFLVSNISTDILYGGRYNSIRAAQRYYDGSAALVLGEQKTETLDAIQFINTLAQEIIINSISAFSYNQDVCRRDVGLILDAVTADMVLGSNYRSIYAGLAYLRSYASEVTDNQKAQTIAGINKARDLAIAATTDSPTQILVANNFAIVTSIINAEALPTGVTLSYSDPVGAAAGVVNSAKVLVKNKQFIVDEIIAYINTNLTPSTIPGFPTTCIKDLGYIVDALVYDIFYGGNSQSVSAANAYITGIINIIGSEVAQTVAAYTRLKEVVGYVILNNTLWTKSASNTTLQDTTLPAGLAAQVTTTQANVQTVITVVNSGTKIATYTDPTFTLGVNYAAYSAYRTTITTTNLEGIKNGVISYLNVTYQSDLSYQNLNNISPEQLQITDTTKNGAVASLTVSSLITLIKNIVNTGTAPADAAVYPKYVLQLSEETLFDVTVHWKKDGTFPPSVILQAAGNTSMLSNDWTQLNDLGYGLVATNNGLIETVSVFTYYCWVAYFAKNGGQIRSVGGSNAHGEYALIAEGNDPFEVPDYVNLADDMVQSVKVYREGPFAAEMIKNQTSIYVDAYGHLPYNVSEIEIHHGIVLNADTTIGNIGTTRYEVAGISDSSSTAFSTPLATFSTLVGTQVKFIFPTKQYAPIIGKYYTVTDNSNANYNKTNLLCVGGDTTFITLEYGTAPANAAGTGATSISLRAQSIIRLNLNTGGNNNTATTGLQAALAHGQLLTVKTLQNFKFYNVDKVNPTRPSTALTFRQDPVDDALAPVYRVLAFNTKGPLTTTLMQDDVANPNDNKSEVILTFDAGYDYISVVIKPEKATLAETDATVGTYVVFGDRTPSSAKTLGSNVGDRYIAVEKITSSRDLLRVQTGEMIFAWEGRVHRVESYTLVPGTGSAAYGILRITETRALVDIGIAGPANAPAPAMSATYQNLAGATTGIAKPVMAGAGRVVTAASVGSGPNYDVTFTIGSLLAAPTAGTYTIVGNNNPLFNGTYTLVSYVLGDTGTITLRYNTNPGAYSSTTLTRMFLSTEVYNTNLVEGNTVTIYIGLTKGEQADIIVNISTCRATSHDFSEIGTGSYNQSNYPNKIYGAPRQPDQNKEVVERTTGRVFWVSTDQDGFFRVGRFFTVDQGTGTVSFAASLALSNLDGLGFKRGRAISEFSDDDTFQDLAQDAVPTEGAVDGYINRRLGITRDNAIVSDGALGVGFIDRAGILSATGDLRLGNNRLTGVRTDPSAVDDAANVGYVKQQQLSDERVDTDLTTPVGAAKANNDLLVYNSAAGKWVNAETTSTGDIQTVVVGKTLALNIKRETIVNVDVNKNAGITQDKLAVNTASTQRDVGVLISNITKTSALTPTTIIKSGIAPNVDIRFDLNVSLAVAPLTGIYYTVEGNANPAYNGVFACVGSTSGTPSSITLRYAVDPSLANVFVIGSTTITPWTTEITTNTLPHEFAVGNTVSISGVTVATGEVINSQWNVLVITSTDGVINKFTIPVNSKNWGAITVTSARATKLGLSAFNKNQLAVTNGFVGFRDSEVVTFQGTITTGSAVITNVSTMANIAVGSVITIASNETVTIPLNSAGSPLTPINIATPFVMTVLSIDSPTQITLSRAFAGVGSALATLNVISGVAMTNIQQVPTDTILGNLSGVASSPRLLTTNQVVRAGDGIRHSDFNAAIFADLAEADVYGAMVLKTKDNNSWANTYGIFGITKSGDANSIVRTDNTGRIDAAAFMLDGKLILDSSSSAAIDMYTQGAVKFMTAIGDSTNLPGTTVFIGASADTNTGDATALQGLVKVPSLTSIGNVTFEAVNQVVSIKPTDNGTVNIYPASIGDIDNMDIGVASHASGKFTILKATELTSVDDLTDSTSTGNGAFVVAGGVGIGKNLNVGGNTVIGGNLIVNGVTSTINSASISVDDKTIELASVGSIAQISGTIVNTGGVYTITGLVDAATGLAPVGLLEGMTLSKVGGSGTLGSGTKISLVNSQAVITFTIVSSTVNVGPISFSATGGTDDTADGGGVLLKGSTNKTILWDKGTGYWTSNVGFKASSINKTPIGNDTDGTSTALFTTLGASGAVTFTSDIEATNSTTGGTLTVTGGAAVSKKLFVGSNFEATSDSKFSAKLEVTGDLSVNINKFNVTAATGNTYAAGTLEVDGKVVFDDTTEASTTGTAPAIVFSAAALKVVGGAFVEKKLIVKGGITANGGVTGDLTGSASKVVTVKKDVDGLTTAPVAYYPTFVGANNAAATGENVFTDAGIIYYPTTNTLEVAVFKGAFNGTVDLAKQVQTKNDADTNASRFLTFVSKDNSALTNETVLTDGNLTYNPKDNILTTTTFSGDLTGTANIAKQVYTASQGASGTYYLNFVNSNNATAGEENIFTNVNIKADPANSGTISAGLFEGKLKGDVTNSAGTVIVDVANAAFKGKADTAAKLAAGISISLTGGVTGEVTGVDGSGNITIATTVAGGGSANNVGVVSTTTDQDWYVTFVDNAGASTATPSSQQLYASKASGGLRYNAGTKTLSCLYYTGLASSASYADLAEKYLADAEYETGTVLVFGGAEEVTQSTQHNDRRVAGVVSEKPAYLMNNGLTGNHPVAVALQGRVPVKVLGRVQKGDMLVTSGKAGYAVVNNDPKLGTVIGKALANKTTDGDGIVEAVVGRV